MLSTRSISRSCVRSTIRLMGTDASKPLAKTAMYNYHLELGGKMVPFADYHLPVQYEGLGVLQEHNHTRAAGCSSVFDVSHMGQIIWSGKDAVKFLEKMVVGDLQSLKAGESKLSLIMNEQGHIVDDTVITNAGDFIYMVVNGACKWKDMDHFKKYMNVFDVKMDYLENQQLLAVQGKGARNAVGALAPSLDLSKMNFMTSTTATVAGIPNCRVTRCGYTGEDGFEISVSEKDTEQLARALLTQPNVKPAGLGARDSLRLEAGLCLYGNDIDETINPVEAALTWTIGGPKSRRRLEQGFLGAEHFLEKSGKLKAITKKRVGIAGMKAPARGHTEIFDKEGKTKIGEVTSGGFGPTFQKPLAMGYVSIEHANEDTDVSLLVRGKMLPAKITKMPFVATDYFKVA